MKEIARDFFYIGTDDLTLDLFESQYVVPEGMAYNSYLIKDDKIAILDTADARMEETWFQHLEEALEGRQPDYLVVHHMEPDHSACIARRKNLQHPGRERRRYAESGHPQPAILRCPHGSLAGGDGEL